MENNSNNPIDHLNKQEFSLDTTISCLAMASANGDKELEIFRNALEAAMKLLDENNIPVATVAESVLDCIDETIEADYSADDLSSLKAYCTSTTAKTFNPIGTVGNPVVAVVKKDLESGGFVMSISNVEWIDVVLVEDDINGDGIEVNGSELVGWSTTCDYNPSLVSEYSDKF
jgi:hypothetical protein